MPTKLFNNVWIHFSQCVERITKAGFAKANRTSTSLGRAFADACKREDARQRLLLEHGAKADGESGAAALKASAAGGHVEAVRLLLERGAKADGKSGAAALRAATSDDVKALLREHGATLTLHEECHDGNVAAIAQLLDGGADVEAKGYYGASIMPVEVLKELAR